MPRFDGKQLMFDQENMTLDEMKDELWKAFEEQPKIIKYITHDYAPW